MGIDNDGAIHVNGDRANVIYKFGSSATLLWHQSHP